MAARYLIRFDDLCPTMDRARWARNELLMRRFGAKPIIAVVPDNRDPELVRSEADPEFWGHMRELQADGWTVGLHGFQHLCQARGRGLVPLHGRSEFAGLPEQEQREKLDRGLEILREHGLEPTVWVAPRHGFDATTLRILRELGIGIVSDGLRVFPHRKKGVFWLPQQLWEPEQRRRGVWTILIHSNTQTGAQFDRLERFLAAHAQQVTAVDAMRIEFGDRAASVEDWAYRFAWMRRRDLQRLAARFR